MMPGGRARVWEVCLPASSSSSSPNSRNRQGRLQWQRERESKQAVPVGGGGAGTGAGGKIQTSKRHPHPSQTGDRHTDADTFSHSGPGPRTPPTLQGHPDTLSQSCQSPEHSLDTHGDPGPRPHPPSPYKPCGLQAAARGWRGDRGKTDSRHQRGCAAKALGAGVSAATLLSQNPVSQDNPGCLAQDPASFPHSQNHCHQKGAWGAGQVEITTFIRHRDRITFPRCPPP